MSTHTTLPHTASSGGDHQKLTWHKSTAWLPLSARWEAVATTDGGFTLVGRGNSNLEAMAELDRQVEAFEAMTGLGGAS